MSVPSSEATTKAANQVRQLRRFIVLAVAVYLAFK